MEALTIEQFNFNKDEVSLLSSTRYKNFPIVYILHNKKLSKPKAYIGQSVQVRNRLNNHLSDKEKRNLDQALVIAHDHFNQSATYNIETKLINYFIADQKYEVINKSQITQSLTHNYYDKPKYDRDIFQNIWSSLRTKGLVNQTVEEIENKDIFKLSPYKELSESQIELKNEILKFCEENIHTDKKAVFFIKGDAGTGKSVVLSSTINTIQDLTKEASSRLYKTENYLLVNHNEMLKTYRTIAKSLPNLKQKNFDKPTPFVNKSKAGKINADITLVDEGHLLLSRPDNFNYFKENNHLEEIIKYSKVTVVVFDERQFLKLKSFWDENLLNSFSKNMTTKTFELTDQFRIQANDKIVEWIDHFVNKEVLDIPDSSDNYELKVFENANDMYEEIKNKNEEFGLSRVVSTFDYEHKKDGQDYFIKEPGFKLPWNRTHYEKTWAEEPLTVNEVGSIYTIQGFDLNYVGVILGPSVSYNEETEQLEIIAKNYRDSEAFRNISTGTPHYELSNAKEQIILNSINVLMKRGVKGLYIYAHDEKLKKVLLKRKG